MKRIKIGSRTISAVDPAYVIAEIGINHQGDVQLAKKLIDCAVEAKADCAKFQKRSLKKVYRKEALEHFDNEEQGSQYLIKKIIESELTNDEMVELATYCASKHIDFMCTPWDEESLSFLASMDLPAYKIGSPDMTNIPLIHKVALLRKPILISTGMSFVSEIEQVVQHLNELNADYMLLHCNSTYPTPYQDINLRFFGALQELSHELVGYSGHDRGISVSIAAVALGAKVIEKHLTLDRTMDGPDHRASLEPDEFAEMVREIRIIEQALGEKARFISRGEYINRQTLSKSLVAAKNLKKGHVLRHSDIVTRSPGKGTSPLKLGLFIGKKLIKRDIKKDDYLLESDVTIRPFEYEGKKITTNRPWGVVARMSDIADLLSAGSDFIEIHLSDSDILTDDPGKKKINRDLVVHGPEYNEDLLLDLSSLDESIRSKSVSFFNKAFDHARKIKKLFKNKNSDVTFVIHPGGFSMEKPLLDQIKKHNKQLVKSLSEINTAGFRPLIENMPSCPWFFGGQWYGSNFMDSEEIVAFSKKTGYGIVLDTSHAALYCNYYKKDLFEYVKNILPVVKYIHISDASGINGEGLQIGDGNINFAELLPVLKKANTWFLPEIWQGHKFRGEGFLKAMYKLKVIDPDF